VSLRLRTPSVLRTSSAVLRVRIVGKSTARMHQTKEDY